MSFENLHCSMSYAVYKFQPEIGEFSACCDANAYSFDQEIFDQLKEDYFEKHPQLIDRKKSLIENIRHLDCVQCWKKEDQGLKSMRMDLGPSYNTLWNNYNLDVKSAYPGRIELWMNSTCNLGCFMCHIGNSNTLRKIWYTDYDTYGNDGRGHEQWLNNSKYTNEKKELFTKAMIDFTIKHIREVRTYELTIAYLGGEPTLHSEMYDHADIFIKAGKQAIKDGKKLTIEFTTNGTSKDKLNDRFYKMFEKYKSAGWCVSMMLSQDGAKEYAQVRHGADFDQIKKNFSNWIHSDSCVDNICSFTVLSNINLPYIDQMADYMNNAIRDNYKNTKTISIHFNALISPEWMQVKYLPKKFVKSSALHADEIFLKIKKDYSNVSYNRSLFLNVTNVLKETVEQKDVEYFFNKLKYVNSVYKKTYPNWCFFNTFPHLREYANDYGIEI
jgi:organic radical activating enzyme